MTPTAADAPAQHDPDDAADALRRRGARRDRMRIAAATVLVAAAAGAAFAYCRAAVADMRAWSLINADVGSADPPGYDSFIGVDELIRHRPVAAALAALAWFVPPVVAATFASRRIRRGLALSWCAASLSPAGTATAWAYHALGTNEAWMKMDFDLAEHPRPDRVAAHAAAFADASAPRAGRLLAARQLRAYGMKYRAGLEPRADAAAVGRIVAVAADEGETVEMRHMAVFALCVLDRETRAACAAAASAIEAGLASADPEERQNAARYTAIDAYRPYLSH